METLFVFLQLQLLNLAMYLFLRQFTIGCLRLNIQKSKFHYVWAIPIPVSTTKDVICCSNGYIYHFCFYYKMLYM